MSEPTYRCHAIIPHPAAPRVWLLPGAGGWGLPWAELPVPDGDNWWRNIGPLNTAIGRPLGWTLTTRYAAYVSTDPAGAVFVLEIQDPAPAMPAGGRWVDRADLTDLPLAVPAHRALLEAGWAEATGSGALPGRPAWTRPGWFAATGAWITEQLGALGLRTTGPIAQERTWSWSCILRVPTPAGDVYCKAAPPLYAYEPALTQALAAAYPAHIPGVLAVDPAKGLLLMAGVPGVKLRQHPDRAQYLPRWEALLRDMARIQRDYVGRIADLTAWGCPDLRLARVASAIDPLLAELPGLRVGSEPGLTPAEGAQLHALAPRLKQMCATLDGCGIPPTLNHGDFHSGNILANDRECRILDWAGFVGIAHPFFCLSVVFEEHIDPAIRARLREVYLHEWLEYGPLDRLRAAADLAFPLGLLAGALDHQAQVHAGPTPWDAAVARENLAWCLRALLASLPAGPA